VIVEEPSKDRQWRYDCLLCRDGKDVVALEVLHSHEFTREKASSVRDSGLEMTEFRGEDILHLLTESSNKTVHLENLLVQLGTCQSCVAKEDLEWMRTCWCDEYRELLHQVFDILDYYRNVEYKQLLEALERARCQLAALERCRRLVEKGVAWWLSCWHAKHSSLRAHSCLCIRPKLAVSAHMLSAPPAGWPAMSFDIFVSGPRGQMLICPASVEGSTSPAQQPIATSCQIMIHPNFEGLQAKRSAVNQNYFASSISVSSPLVLPTRLLDFRHRRQTGPSSFDFPA
jgi:hypothetical protein